MILVYKIYWIHLELDQQEVQLNLQILLLLTLILLLMILILGILMELQILELLILQTVILDHQEMEMMEVLFRRQE